MVRPETVRFKAEVTLMGLEPLATSASAVSICSAFRLAERAGVERVPLLQDDPLTDTSWHNWTAVDPDPLKSSAPSATLALHGAGVGDAPQFSRATWLATASLQMASHWDAVSDVVRTLDVVRRPPDAVTSWFTVTNVSARPFVANRGDAGRGADGGQDVVEHGGLLRVHAGQVGTDGEGGLGRDGGDGGPAGRAPVAAQGVEPAPEDLRDRLRSRSP